MAKWIVTGPAVVAKTKAGERYFYASAELNDGALADGEGERLYELGLVTKVSDTLLVDPEGDQVKRTAAKK